jgi:hypothetical protein
MVGVSFTPGYFVHCIRWKGGWVGPIAGLSMIVKRDTPVTLLGIETPLLSKETFTSLPEQILLT